MHAVAPNITQRLREAAPEGLTAGHVSDLKVLRDAADEIERLRGLIAAERIACGNIVADFANEFDDENMWAAARAIRERPIVTY